MADPMAVEVSLLSGMAFEAEAGTGYKLPMDGGPDVGGEGRGFRPMELLLAGLGGCTGMDVVYILRRMRQRVEGFQVKVDGDRSDQHPKVYTSITVEYLITGRGLDEASVRKAVELSAKQYCPASAMLGKAVPIAHRYRIIDPDTGLGKAGEL